MRGLRVGGLVPFTAIDYPGKLAAVVFVQGCPWRCRYCHNPHLQSREGDSIIAWDEVMAMLRRRVGLIDAVVFSGGEPTLDPALPAAMTAVRELGFAIGLHTACIYPEKLALVLPLIDWIGFDVKTAFADYERITGVRNSGDKAGGCVDLILASGVEHECRTTIHPALMSERQILALATSLAEKGVRNYALQLVRTRVYADTLLPGIVGTQFPADHTVQTIAAMFPRFTLRGSELAA
jgi:anaerobic ribonucleoside-triphosphate reductase activating protein